MTSPAKIAANRRNAQRSTGPRSAAGKARARHNRFRHGLSTPASLDHVATERINQLVDALTGDFHNQREFELATLAAEAQVEIERVRQTKITLVNRASAQLRDEGAAALSIGERVALALAGKAKILMTCERYERRAISKRKRALHTLAKIQREFRRAMAMELVGPPRPKSQLNRHYPFHENVLRLQVSKITGSTLGLNLNRSSTYEWWKEDWDGLPSPDSRSSVAVYVNTVGDRGFLKLTLQVDGEPIEQKFELFCREMGVGVRWAVECPETGKMVRDLYLVGNNTRFRSRHALGLSYLSHSRKKRDWARALGLMNRLGAVWGEPVVRPKRMPRRTFKRLEDELRIAWRRDERANLG